MQAILVSDQSHVAEARRLCTVTATGFGFDETAAARVALVVTELATNLIKHSNGGEILVGTYEDTTGHGIELVSLDKGAGMHDVQACMADGYSTAGSPGTGMGAIQRNSTSLDIYSRPGQGTAIVARCQAGRLVMSGEKMQPPQPHWSAVMVPKSGEQACGDGWSVASGALGRAYLVADGLGHGPEAANASSQAARAFNFKPIQTSKTAVEEIHAALRSTRGAAIAVAVFDAARNILTFSGIGNIAGTIVYASGEIKKLVSMNGTAGHQASRIQEFEYRFAPSDFLILHSDGLSTSWNIANYPGLISAHPTLIAGVLYRDHSRRRDDSVVLVARGEAI